MSKGESDRAEVSASLDQDFLLGRKMGLLPGEGVAFDPMVGPTRHKQMTAMKDHIAGRFAGSGQHGEVPREFTIP